MLRHVAKPSTVQRLSSRNGVAGVERLFATSREKRALNKSQLEGSSKGSPAPKTPASSASPPPAGGSGGGSSLPVVLGLVGAAGAGAAYYQGLIPGLSPHPEEVAEKKQEQREEAATVETKTEVKVEEKLEKKEQTPAPVVEDNKKEEVKDEVKDKAKDEETGNRVMTISLPKGSKRSAPPASVYEHPEGGNKVAMNPPPPPGDSENTPTVDAALEELQSQLSRETSRVLSEAHKELAKLSSLDFTELDNMTPSQLKIRLVQMAKDLEDRTKWEAVRLKEFLAMKEKEVEDKYIVLLKKNRLESEATLEIKLQEQLRELTLQTERTILEKEKALQAIVDNSLKIQEEQYNEEKSAFEKRTEEAANAKYEEMFGKSLAETKKEFAQKLEQKVQQIEALTKTLADLEFSLQNTKEYQSDSMQAHRMSAAALSLIDKLESSKPAGAAIAALQAVAEENVVINSALNALPASVSTSGIATLQELQTKFEEQVYRKCRQAALIPSGRKGLEGQLLGMVFATLKFAPGPEDAAPETEKDASEFVLARARRHVQLGELDQAVEQMDKLAGQAAFVAKDWTESAKERMAVEKALKAIRLECALTNESMGHAPTE